MQQKFDMLQEEIAAGQDDATERVVKKLRVDQGYTFKKKDTNTSSASTPKLRNE